MAADWILNSANFIGNSAGQVIEIIKKKINQAHVKCEAWKKTSAALSGRLGNILAVLFCQLTSGVVHQKRTDASVK